eukprot:scaffold83395_cov72-Phaeocystis_antarctica.AAC.1
MRVSMLLGMRNGAGQCVGASGTAPSMPPAASAFRTRPPLQRAPKIKSTRNSEIALDHTSTASATSVPKALATQYAITCTCAIWFICVYRG